MSGEIIPLPLRPSGNGAREAMIGIMSSASTECLGPWDAPAVTDYIIALLQRSGFKIVPIESGDAA